MEDDQWRPVVGDVSRQTAAQGQLQTAILLWFQEADPVSTHTLAVAARGILVAAQRDRKMPPSPFAEMMQGQPRSFKDWMANPQNFFKHGDYRGRKRHKEAVPHTPKLTELMIADSVGMFHRLYGSTPGHGHVPALVCYRVPKEQGIAGGNAG